MPTDSGSSADSREPAPGSAFRGLVIIFSAVVLATDQFIKAGLPGRSLVVPTEVILYLVLLLRVVPVLALFSLDWLIAARFSRRALRIYRSVILGLALVMIVRQLELFSPTDSLADAIRSLSPLLLALIVAALAAFAFWAAFRFYSAVSKGFFYFALPSLVLTLLLLAHQGGPNGDYRDYNTAEVEPGTSAGPPVVVVVFDMLAYDALLAVDGGIDATRFPNFARLANDSLTLENATTNFSATVFTVPSLVDSVISLQDDYEVRLYEQTPWIETEYTSGCAVHFTCKGHRYLTEQNHWRLIGTVIERSLGAALPIEPEIGTNDPGDLHWLSVDLFELFIEDLRSDSASGRVFFLHSHLPHDPFSFNRNGDFSSEGERSFERESAVAPDSDTFTKLWDHYIEQIEYTDSLLGRLMDKLEGEDIYEDVVLIVTSDHGLRSAYPHEETPIEVDAELARVPMFIRAPGVEPGKSTVDYQHVDFAPTILDLLGYENISQAPPRTTIPLPEGVSIFAESRPGRAKEFFVTTENRYWRYVYNASTGTWPLSDSVEGTVRKAPELID